MDSKTAMMQYDTAAKALPKLGCAGPMAGRRGVEKRFVEAFKVLYRARHEEGQVGYMKPKRKYMQ